MWEKTGNYLHKKFTFSSFMSAIEFVKDVAEIAELIQHHPSIVINFNVVELYSTTTDENSSITDKDTNLMLRIIKLASLYYGKNKLVS